MTKKELQNLYQKAWEEWYYRVKPSGDCSSVHDQWLNSYEYEDFCIEYNTCDEEIK